MAGPYAACKDLADQITQAGVRATTDPADAHRPVVLVTPRTVEDVAADGTGWTVTADVVLLPGPAGAAGQQWAWDTALPVVLRCCGWDDIRADLADDATPAVIVRTTLRTRG